MVRYITSSKEVVEESLGGNQGDEALDEICRLNERNIFGGARAPKKCLELWMNEWLCFNLKIFHSIIISNPI